MKEENGRLKKKSRVFEIAVKGGSKFYLSLGELETLLGWGYQKWEPEEEAEWFWLKTAFCEY